jgi:CheY-like chemotaxis protein/HPt (histidine-containing phosphotransfer) domain-containing protein
VLYGLPALSSRPIPRELVSVQQQLQAAAFRTSRTSLAGANVLIAEDNLVNLEVARFHLEDLGCVSASAVNGAEALALAERQPFDFILMDCQMPVMDGFAALHAIRGLGAGHVNATTPILAVTAADDAQSKSECARAGFDGFLAKPYSAEQLRMALLREVSPVIAVDAPATDGESLLDAAAFRAFVDDFGIDTAPSLLESYVKSLADSIPRFHQCVAASDLRGLQALGHKLAGASGMVGARRLQMLAKDIDAMGKQNRLGFTPEVMALGDEIVAAHRLFEPLCGSAALEDFLATSPHSSQH